MRKIMRQSVVVFALIPAIAVQAVLPTLLYAQPQVRCAPSSSVNHRTFITEALSAPAVLSPLTTLSSGRLKPILIGTLMVLLGSPHAPASSAEQLANEAQTSPGNNSQVADKNKSILVEFLSSAALTRYFNQGQERDFLLKAAETDKKLGANGVIENAMREVVTLASRLTDDEAKRKARTLFYSTIQQISPTMKAYLFFEPDQKRGIVYRVIVLDVTHTESLRSASGDMVTVLHGDRIDSTNHLGLAHSASIGGGIILFFTDKINQSLDTMEATLAKSVHAEVLEIRSVLGVIREKTDREAMKAALYQSIRAHEFAHHQIQSGKVKYAFNSDASKDNPEFYRFGQKDWNKLSLNQQLDIEEESAAYLSQVVAVAEFKPEVLPLHLFLLIDGMAKGDRAAQFILNQLADRPRNAWVQPSNERAALRLYLDLLNKKDLSARGRTLLDRCFPGIEPILATAPSGRGLNMASLFSGVPLLMNTHSLGFSNILPVGGIDMGLYQTAFGWMIGSVSIIAAILIWKGIIRPQLLRLRSTSTPSKNPLQELFTQAA